MNYPRHHAPRHSFQRNRRVERPGRHSHTKELANPESTGTEASYLKSLIDSHAKVTVKMITGEKFLGHIRYYDQYCFSVGLLKEKKKVFLRKDSVAYIAEE